MKPTPTKTNALKYKSPWAKPVAMALIISQLAGCGMMPRAVNEPTLGPDQKLIADATREAEESVVDIDAGYEASDMFLLKPMGTGGALPAKQVAPFNLNEAGIYDTMRILLRGTGLTLKVEGGVHGSEQYGAVTMFDVQGSLSDVMEEMSQSMGFFYTVKNKTLVIQPERQFVVALPPALNEDNTAFLTNTLQFMGAKEPYIDRMTRSLIFKANRSSFEKIEEYLNSVRTTRSMIIYSVNIFQVDLLDNQDTGIQWNKLGWAAAPGSSISTGASTTTTGTTGPTAATTGSTSTGNSVQGAISGLGLGLVLSTAKFNVDMLVNYLKTQGTVQSISQPRISVMSGSNASMSVGRTQTYVSKVGTTFSTALSQLTTETKDLKTGVDMALHSDFSDNTVYTNLDLKISDLVKLAPFLALGTSLVLPETINRNITTVVRSKPGDMILLGGITITRDSREDNRGISNNGFAKSVTKSELVLAMRAKVVNFLPKGEKEKRDAARKAAGQVVPVTNPLIATAPVLSHTKVNPAGKGPEPMRSDPTQAPQLTSKAN